MSEENKELNEKEGAAKEVKRASEMTPEEREAARAARAKRRAARKAAEEAAANAAGDATGDETGDAAAESAKADEGAAKEVKRASEMTPEERAAARAERAKRRAAKKAAEEGNAEEGKVEEGKAGGSDSAEEEVKPPSPHQPRLDKITKLIQEHVSDQAIEEAYINELDRHLPTIVIRSEYLLKCAELFRDHEELKLDYLRNVSGVDYESHLEVVYHLLALSTKEEYCVKVKTDREEAQIASVTSIWNTANWNEREIYDLLGIDFPGHPDMRRIMMPDDWVGHPLRKDYEPYDPEV